MTALFLSLLALVAVCALVLLVPAVRRPLLGAPIFRIMKKVLPTMSDTEREALEAGTVWWDADLFSGAPDWKKLLDTSLPGLSEREQAFLDGPVKEVCALATDWEIERHGELPMPVWDALKRHRLLGMIIPESYGGLGFSARGHAAVVTACASRSVGLAVTVMVPNSLGPAELLLHYGTEEQKNHWLPRLAQGEEIPCFALTEPNAGSDAASLSSSGVVCRGTFQGREVLGMRLNWDKRYTTLAPVATVIGLAFRLSDPDGLLGGVEDVGITCALIPTDVEGVEIGERHDPLGVPFHNGPTRGRDVFVPVDFIIGGPARAGEGWRMLMQSLAAGRSISLPSLAAGAAQVCVRATGAYSSVRRQFRLPIGRFEGIQEPLGRIAGMAYLMDAARTVTAASVDLGEKPSVLSAVVKAYCTEGMREVVNDAMDVFGGAGISRGPRNVLAGGYTSLPIGITVEGANILTRTMIVFGQGALRCHPYARLEVEAAAADDLAAFDAAFFAHMGFVVKNAGRSLFHGLTGARLAGRVVPGPEGRQVQRMTRLAAGFALCADVAMATLGSDLKRREMLSGRLADALAWLYLGTCSLKRFVDDGSQERMRPCVTWALDLSLCNVEKALNEFLDNLPSRPAAWITRRLIFPLGSRPRRPADALTAKLARGIQDGGPLWHALSADIFEPAADDPGLGRLQAALGAQMAAAPWEKAVKKAVREKTLTAAPAETLLDRAVTAGVINAEQAGRVEAARRARDEASAVDSFPAESYARLTP